MWLWLLRILKVPGSINSPYTGCAWFSVSLCTRFQDNILKLPQPIPHISQPLRKSGIGCTVKLSDCVQLMICWQYHTGRRIWRFRRTAYYCNGRLHGKIIYFEQRHKDKCMSFCCNQVCTQLHKMQMLQSLTKYADFILKSSIPSIFRSMYSLGLLFQPNVQYFFLWRNGPQWAMTSFTRFLDHIQRRTTVSRTHLDEWSARRRGLYLTTHNTNKRQTSMHPAGFEPTISAGERPQTHVLDSAATGIG